MTQMHYGDMDYAPKKERTDFGFAKIEIDSKVCDGCVLCTVICPAGILEVVGRRPDRRSKVREVQDNCIGCACCEAICLTGAIRLIRSYDFGGYWKQLDRGELSKPRCF